MIKKILPFVLLIGLVSWGIYDYVRSSDEGMKEQTEQQEEVGINQGNIAPNFTLETLEGGKTKLTDYRGKNIIVNFWATWCPPCRAEMPDMQSFYDKHHDEDFVILAVNLTSTESNRSNIQPFLEELGVTFPVLLDEENEVAEEYKVVGYPTSYFIDKAGTIRYKVVGPMNREFMQKQVKAMNK